MNSLKHFYRVNGLKHLFKRNILWFKTFYRYRVNGLKHFMVIV